MRMSDPADLAQLFAERVNALDVDGALELYEATATLVLPGRAAASGHAQIRARLAEMTAARAQIDGVGCEVAAVSDDLALMSSSWQMTLRAVPASPSFTGSSLEVARRQPDGRWLYAIDRPAPSVTADG